MHENIRLQILFCRHLVVFAIGRNENWCWVGGVGDAWNMEWCLARKHKLKAHCIKQTKLLNCHISAGIGQKEGEQSSPNPFSLGIPVLWSSSTNISMFFRCPGQHGQSNNEITWKHYKEIVDFQHMFTGQPMIVFETEQVAALAAVTCLVHSKSSSKGNCETWWW